MSIHTEAAVRELSKEIERLTAMRDSLLTSPTGVPASIKSKAAATRPTTTKPLSAQTKKRIAEAQKKRWADLKKAAAAPAKATAKK